MQVRVMQGGVTLCVRPTLADVETLRAAGLVPADASVVVAPEASDVRAEASRRMQALVGARNAEHMAIIVSNGVREQGRLQAIRTGIPGVAAAREWTAAEAARAAELWAFDQAIEAIRAASNAMEADPPADFAADARWPATS